MKSYVLRAALAVILSTVLVHVNSSATSAASIWHGVAADGDPNIRSAPSTSAPIVGQLTGGSPIQVIGWVKGERVSGVNATWAELAPGQFVYSAGVRKPLPAAPPPAPQTFLGHWIDANLTEQILTAYDGDQPVFWAVMSSGAPDTPSDTGVHRIVRRSPNVTMSSATLLMRVEIPYNLPNVLWTQYFNDYGAAIHDNYWKGDDSPFGVPTSHGCLGVREADALKFWNWADVGTVLNLHY